MTHGSKVNILICIWVFKNIYTGSPQKNDALFWRAVEPQKFELGIKVCFGILRFSALKCI